MTVASLTKGTSGPRLRLLRRGISVTVRTVAPTTVRRRLTPFRLETETTSLLSRMTVQPSTAQMYRINQLIAALKTAGIWARADGIWLMAAHTEQAACLNWKSTAFPLTPVGSPTFFANTGYKGDGVAAHLTCIPDLAAASLGATLDDMSQYVWITTDLPGATSEVAAALGANVSGIRAKSVNSASFFTNGTVADTLRVNTTKGLTGWSRDSATSVRVSRSGASAVKTRASVALPARPWNFLRASNGATHSPNGIAFGFIGKSLTVGQEARLYSALLAYLIGVGAIEDDDQAGEDSPIDPPHCWTNSTMASVPAPVTRVSQQSFPPSSNSVTNATYAYWPGNVYASQDIVSIAASTWTSGGAWHFIWNSRIQVPVPASGVYPNARQVTIYPPFSATSGANNGRECRLSYTTLARSMADERIRLMWSAGYSNAAIVAEAAGVGITAVAPFTDINASRVVTWATLNAAKNSTAVFDAVSAYNSSWCYSTGDYIYLPKDKLVNCVTAGMKLGFMLDAEHQDGRTTAEQLAHVQSMAALAAGAPTGPFEFAVYTNELTANSQKYTGLGDPTTLQTLIVDPNVSYISILVTPPTTTGATAIADMLAQLEGQKALFGGVWDASKIMLVIGIGETNGEFTNAECTELRNWIVTNGIEHVQFWRYGGNAGGALSRQYNQVIARTLGLPTS